MKTVKEFNEQLENLFIEAVEAHLPIQELAGLALRAAVSTAVFCIDKDGFLLSAAEAYDEQKRESAPLTKTVLAWARRPGRTG